MKISLPLLAGPLGVVLVSALAWQSSFSARALSARDLVLVPFAVDAVRVPGVCSAHVLIYEPREAPLPTRITRVRILADGLVLYEESTAIELFGAADYGEVNALIERLPESITGLHRARRWFSAPDARGFTGPEAFLRWSELTERLADLRARYASGAPRPFIELEVPLPLDQLFSGNEALGTTRTVTFEVDYRGPDGLPATASVPHTVRWLGPRLQPAATLANGTAVAYAGDLHVHSCHGEALNACDPFGNCPAESSQTTASFSYAQLKSQMQVLGLDWFSATDHSFCVNTDAKYTTISDEVAALNEASFFAFPDIELSSLEVGDQTGSDAANSKCLFTAPQNHMGAHGIETRKQGGNPAVLGFCTGLADFASNAAAIRAEGGWPIVHHPAAKSNAWNSLSSTQGIEAGQMHGVEISHGHLAAPESKAVGVWVDWLLGGRILYGYSGSDNHGAAFAFSATHAVLIDEPYTPENLLSAIYGGRAYISDQHSLQIEVVLASESLFMGTLQALPIGVGPQAATVRVHYDFGADTATLWIFEGRVGDAAESMLCTTGPLTGSGVFECAATVSGSVNSWYRAQSLGGGARANTNPVFFLAGTGDVATYCTAKLNSQGCTPAVSWNGLPSASLESPFTVRATSVLNNKSGLLFYGLTPSAVPFQGGTKCVTGPTRRTQLQNSAGNPPPDDCSGSYSYDFQDRIHSGVDTSLVAGATVYCQFWSRDLQAPSTTGLTDAVRFTIQP